jgi:hypothetical protein
VNPFTTICTINQVYTVNVTYTFPASQQYKAHGISLIGFEAYVQSAMYIKSDLIYVSPGLLLLSSECR